MMAGLKDEARLRIEAELSEVAFASTTEQLEAVIAALKNRPGRVPVLPEVLSEELKLVGSVCAAIVLSPYAVVVRQQPILENIELLNRLKTNPRVEIVDGMYRFKVSAQSLRICFGRPLCDSCVVPC